MAGYQQLVNVKRALTKRLHDFSGTDEVFIRNIIHFAECLLDGEQEFIDEKIFRAVMVRHFGLIDMRLVHKLYYNFTRDTQSKGMTVENFCRIICLFFSDNEDMKIDYVFSVIDVNEDLVLQKYELQMLIKPARCMTDHDDEDKDETFLDLCNMFYQILGMDNQCLDIHIFRQKVKEDPLFAYVLGQIIPASEVAREFKEKIYGKSYREINDMFGDIRYDLLYEMRRTDEFKYYPIKIDYP